MNNYVTQQEFYAAVKDLHAHLDSLEISQKNIHKKTNYIGSKVTKAAGKIITMTGAAGLLALSIIFQENVYVENSLLILEDIEDLVIDFTLSSEIDPMVYDVKYSSKSLHSFLTGVQIQALMDAIGAKEGNYLTVSRRGYLGKYQFGAEMLTELGFIKRENFDRLPKYTKNGVHGKAHKQFLLDSSNWTIAGGSVAFLNSKSLQDSAFLRMVEGHLKYLIKNGVINENTSPEKIGGVIFAAQFGRSKVKKLVKYGLDSHDGNKVKTSYYYSLGVKAIQNAGGQHAVSIQEFFDKLYEKIR